MKFFILFAISILPYAVVAYQTQSPQKEEGKKKKYYTKKVQTSVILDGIIDEVAWDAVAWGGDFTQWQPSAGEPPSEKTSFKILYTQRYLYVAIRAYDREPENIVKRMSRRDGFDGDLVQINIDSYFDKRTAFSFAISVSGVRGDEYVSNNGSDWDSNWDPIWRARTNIDEEGWTAEMQIPFSQLRFAEKDKYVWGIQFTRQLFRKEERSNWVPVPQNPPGWVHLFGELHGITDIKPKNPLEIQPYLVAKTEHYEAEEGNPFATGKGNNLTVGINGKIGLTNDVTLDFTINPDFGQVEADPSQVNLSAFQVFFRERRPFFVEGNNILNFGLTANANTDSDFDRDNLFYSRRVGRNPSGGVTTETNDHVDFPSNTHIIAATKVTGKNKNGFSFGLLESVTKREFATIDRLGDRHKQEVEPLTNYFVARIQQDFKEGSTYIGGMLTGVYRDIATGSALDFLHKQAYSGGLDFVHNIKDRTYTLSINTVFSHVNGTTAAILNTQTRSEHLFQRPDADHLTLDSTLTSLMGTGGTVIFGKNTGKLVFQSGTTWRSPKLELNDAGFMRVADRINVWNWISYRAIQRQKGIFRRLQFNLNQGSQFDFDGKSLGNTMRINVNSDFKNLWGFGGGFYHEGNIRSNADLRGGPAIIYPGAVNYWVYFRTNDRKKISFAASTWQYFGKQNYAYGRGINFRMNLQPMDALSISLRPRFSRRRNDMQYVTTESYLNTDRYIIATIDQKTYSMQIRMNYSIKPNLSIQYYGQPFVTSGNYSAFKRITDAKASILTNRFERLDARYLHYNDQDAVYEVDEDRDGLMDYSFGQPSFNFVQFRSNLVLRWEYKPGSTLFLVWNEQRTDDLDITTDSSVGGMIRGLFDKKPHDIFLIKFTYRFYR